MNQILWSLLVSLGLGPGRGTVRRSLFRASRRPDLRIYLSALLLLGSASTPDPAALSSAAAETLINNGTNTVPGAAKRPPFFLQTVVEIVKGGPLPPCCRVKSGLGPSEYRLVYTHTISESSPRQLPAIEDGGFDVSSAVRVFNKRPVGSGFVCTCGCDEDPNGDPSCTLPGAGSYMIFVDVTSPGTLVNYACIVFPPDSVDCTCIQIALPSEEVSECSPIDLIIFVDGFESGDVSAWSGSAP
jgi:hypothetical protein